MKERILPKNFFRDNPFQNFSAAPLLLKEYERMKREYPEESLCQGPLLGLYAMYDKI